MYAIKAKRPSETRWAFVTADGHRTMLRLHAARFPDKGKAEAIAADLTRDNPEFQFRVTPLSQPA